MLPVSAPYLPYRELSPLTTDLSLTAMTPLCSRDSMFTQNGARQRPSSVGHLVDHTVHSSPSQVFSNHKSASSTQANSISLDSSP